MVQLPKENPHCAWLHNNSYDFYTSIFQLYSLTLLLQANYAPAIITHLRVWSNTDHQKLQKEKKISLTICLEAFSFCSCKTIFEIEGVDPTNEGPVASLQRLGQNKQTTSSLETYSPFKCLFCLAHWTTSARMHSLVHVQGIEEETFPCLFSLMTLKSDGELATDVMKHSPSEPTTFNSPSSFLLMKYHDLTPSFFPTNKQSSN